ncbi:hypothetical protein GCM10011492_31730 [Flexivirga endophytica]|uniref:DUF885 domain-containing protein n=1 Tax=Flexivirga endophytica TaxID=1849103 RepID=A0A916WW30_9MICO|nr:DUF885 domain-containing protein [Flexivirga endophytica]GGB38621.1 hypothetical protein GCM10011492_31730 [Flexivirga endophytica]GHB46620.1 hypothetical protein GCM10008112_14120 [Flexivirga endophytica]
MTDDLARTPTPVDAIANGFHEKALALSPMWGTYLGSPDRQDELDDFSPAGLARTHQLHRETLQALDGVTAADDVDKVTVDAMRERLGLDVELYDAHLQHASLNVIASPLQDIRDIFDLMPTDTAEQIDTIGRRMRAVPRALDQWFESLHVAADKDVVSPVRQVRACIQQTKDHTAPEGYFAILKEQHPQIADAIDEAAAAYAKAGDRLQAEILPLAPESDACGRDAYSLHSRYFLGATVDLEETYAWGQEELARITDQMQQIAEQIKPGATVKQAMAVLDSDPDYTLHGTDELQRWMQGKADEAIANLGGSHFDIPEPARTIECCIAPTQSGGIYYTSPSEDFSRPGRMWWSVPKGEEDFSTWRELTTVYHEGVPGHHLQNGQTIFRSALLNSWRRLDVWCSGHGEGWALYAERLMDDLGYLQDPGNKLGMLDGQSLRAARVVLDIGVHCGFDAPEELGGGAWTYDKAWAFLNAHCDMGEGFLRFELDRYLGWPGQAPSYKIGERIWLQLRDEARAAEGADFDLKAFHRRALDIGSVGLDTLRGAVLGTL